MIYIAVSIATLSILIGIYTLVTISDLSSKIDKLEESIKKLEKKLSNTIVDSNDTSTDLVKRVLKLERRK
jgi:uncharacterized protein YoxC